MRVMKKATPMTIPVSLVEMEHMRAMDTITFTKPFAASLVGVLGGGCVAWNRESRQFSVCLRKALARGHLHARGVRPQPTNKFAAFALVKERNFLDVVSRVDEL